MMIDWFGGSKKVHYLTEEVAALRAELADFREERMHSLTVETQRKEIAKKVWDRVSLITAELSELREALDTLNREAVRFEEWRAGAKTDLRVREEVQQEHSRLEIVVLKLEKRLQLQAEQAAKAATALFERIERLRPIESSDQ